MLLHLSRDRGGISVGSLSRSQHTCHFVFFFQSYSKNGNKKGHKSWVHILLLFCFLRSSYFPLKFGKELFFMCTLPELKKCLATARSKGFKGQDRVAFQYTLRLSLLERQVSWKIPQKRDTRLKTRLAWILVINVRRRSYVRAASLQNEIVPNRVQFPNEWKIRKCPETFLKNSKACSVV